MIIPKPSPLVKLFLLTWLIPADETWEPALSLALDAALVAVEG